MVFCFYIYIYLKRSPPCLYRSQSLEFKELSQKNPTNNDKQKDLRYLDHIQDQ
jgi:hypothetical protein